MREDASQDASSKPVEVCRTDMYLRDRLRSCAQGRLENGPAAPFHACRGEEKLPLYQSTQAREKRIHVRSFDNSWSNH